ncbi:hypothetical protein JCM10212_006247 [Sporobolomyces blumeae]
MPSPSPSPVPRPRPSPSLSPSITSLLNNSNDDQTPFSSHDYFSPDSSSSGSLFSTLTAPSQPGGPPPAAPAPVPPPPPPGPASAALSASSSSSSLKRSRPSSSPQTPNGPPGSMDPPPATRPRPSSSRQPLPPPPPPPSASASAPSASTPASAPHLARRGSELPLEPSVFNVEPIDEFTREVADWLWGFCAPLDWDKVEIEAKIGLLVDSRAGGSRVYLPVPTEAILTDDSGLRFQSNMTVTQHKQFNKILNARVVETAHPSYPFARVAYAHTKELDTFHDLPVAINGNGNGNGVGAGGGGRYGRRKVRVTRDEKKKATDAPGATGGEWRAVEKIRVADMNVFSPKRLFDWRVSVSLENPVLEHPDTPPTHSRRKDRISYSHQLYQIDLTQVMTPQPPSTGPGQPPGGGGGGGVGLDGGAPTHELEIEFKDAKKLLIEAEKESRGEPNWYLEGVQGLLNNVRMLIRNACDP